MDAESIKTASGYLLASFLTTVGLTTIINPVFRSQNFGVAARPDDKATLAFIRPMGARDLSLGLTSGVLLFQGAQKTAGLVLFVGLLAPAMDAWAAWSYNGRMKEAWSHAFGACTAGALGLWLMG